MPQHFVKDIAARLGTAWRGDQDAVVEGAAPLDEAGGHDISFLADRRYREAALASKAAAIIAPRDTIALPSRRTLLVEDPHEALIEVLGLLYPASAPTAGVHPMAAVCPTARIHPSAAVEAFVSVGAHAVIERRAFLAAGSHIGAEVRIGEDTRIGPNAVIMDGVIVGRRVRIGPGSIVGSVGFGFVRLAAGNRRIPHVGSVVIEDDAEIGASCTIDRATLGTTRIGRGAKLDNLVHIGHNVVVGEDALIAAQCGLSGSATLGAGAMMGGQAGLADHVVVAPGTRIAAKAGVMKSITPRDGVSAPEHPPTFAGSPARPLMQQRRGEAALRHIGDLRRRVRELERLFGASQRDDSG